MAEETNSEVKEVENGFDTNPPAISEESSVGRVPVMDVGNVEDFVSKVQEEIKEDVKSVVSKGQEEIKENVKSVVSKVQEEIKEVAKPQPVTLRRHSTEVIGTKAGKPQVQSRYRGNYQGSSIHEFCKHGIEKKCVKDDAVKPWKVARKKNVEGSESVTIVTPALRRKSLGSGVSGPVTKPENFVAAKRDVLAVRKKPSPSVNSESSNVSETAKSVDGLSVKSNDKGLSSGSALVKKVPAVKKAPKTIDAESGKVCAPKNKEKAKTQAVISCEDVKEKTVRVVESSIKSVQPSSEKKRLTTPKQIPSGNISTGLSKKQETVSADPKPEKKMRPKRTGVKVTLATQLSFKRGKILEPKSEDTSPRWTRFRKRVIQEQKTQTEGRKKTLKSVVETKNDSVEGSKREKVVLRHRKAEGKKKMMTLFNNVIEETMHKLTKVRKTKVKALIGAFETVISLQDTKTPQKGPIKATPSASNKVSPLVSKQ